MSGTENVLYPTIEVELDESCDTIWGLIGMVGNALHCLVNRDAARVYTSAMMYASSYEEAFGITREWVTITGM